ncbi:MAG: outer membrane lipoprotein carrier protein LolA [Paludibacteraceae bacterium]|nr:outer membrane lipoprotein carrier protein LolA [Paludibacteraceae bacterium]MBQ9101285.1 outer membrane lipoprotein carrier protein LolA [Paludibacteraceae bacterium]MBR6659938.1 outer membrane lipoprotein carrier protein LolA [Paludibacteraceae bacterium]
MKKSFLILVSFIFSVSLMAQEKTTPVSDVNALKSEMQQSASKIKTISSDFTQEKFMSVMASKMVSKGKFYYQKEDKVTLQYLTPFKQNLVMNGTKLMMEANGKKNVLDATSNPMMAELKKVISACMGGNIASMGSDYKLEFFQTGGLYLIKIYPQSANIKKVAEMVDLYLDKKDFSVVKMKMLEPLKKGQKTNDYTEYIFENKKFNSPIDASVFSIK